MSNSLEQRIKALEALRGLSADGELSQLEAERRAIAAHGEGLAGFYAWAQTPAGRARLDAEVFKPQGAPA
jgi:hypothetical protein